MKKLFFVILLLVNCCIAKDLQYFDDNIKKIDELITQKKYNKAINLINKIKTGKNNISNEEFEELSKKAQEINQKKKENNFENQFFKEFDPYKKITKYRIKKIIPYTFESYILIDEKNNISFMLTTEIRHVGRQWLFPKTISFLYNNDKVFTIAPEVYKNDVNCGGGGSNCIFYENTRIILNDKEIKTLLDVVIDKNSSARAYGDNGKIDLLFFEQIKQCLYKMISLYYKLCDKNL